MGFVREYFLRNADQNNVNSISYKLRNKRKILFLEFISNLKRPVKILDLGGSEYFWRNLNLINLDDIQILLVNTEFQNVENFSNINFINKDVKDLSEYSDKEFDVVHSNSLIEHLNTFDEQKKLAAEIQRIGKHYFLQTPNYYFPLEPHFLYPFFQFFSHKKKTELIQKKDMGWYKKQENLDDAEALADSIRLMKKSELKNIFKNSKIHSEKYFLFTKSFIVYN
ncbi:MAG: class I SAM-dependent methyltransferase [Ignavibacteria bacterium]